MQAVNDDRPSDIRDRTYHCGTCGAVMLRPAAELREAGPHCSICGEALAEKTEPQLAEAPS